MSQTSNYTLQSARAFAGMLADVKEADMISLALEDATAMGFGLGAMLGTDGEKEFILPSGAGEFAGVTVHTHAQENPGGEVGTAGIVQGEPASLLRKGRVWVLVDEAIALTDEVWVRHTGGDEGLFRTDIDTANAQQITGAKWLSTTAGAGLALLDLNHP